MPIDLTKLNDEQREAVLHGAGPLLIVAGAGTGKTTVITQRIVNLIEKGSAKPEEILAVTFTEKAAFEMEERVDKLLDFGYVGLSLFVALMLSFVWGAWSAFYRSASPQAQSRSAAIVAFTVSIVIGQSAASIYDNLLPVFMLAGACVGMPILPVKHRSTGGRGSNGSGFGKLDSGLERRPEEVNR